ncbi:MAG: hypothetical protein HFACDABA_02747 [Anaerolineales bacterium]|nr:hypothetical protein [Anaerolineales bacterium]
MVTVRHGTTLNYLLSDHLGSSSVTTDENGIQTAQAMYKTFGETRYFIGDLKTDYTFTGQREEASLGLYFFVARWLDPSLGRFTSPDTIVPTSTQGTQAWDRYAFVNNNPVRYTDPTGHKAREGEFDDTVTCNDPSAENLGADGQCIYPKPAKEKGGSKTQNSPNSQTSCVDGPGIELLCLTMDGTNADELEDALDGLSNALDPISIISGVVGLILAGATSILGPIIGPASIALLTGLTVEAVVVTGLFLTAAAVGMEIISSEMSAISENMDESGVTTTGGSITVSSIGGVVFVYTASNPAGETHTSYGISFATPLYLATR